MWPILISSVVGLAIAIERLWAFSRLDIDTSRFLIEVRKAIHNRQLAQAERLCAQIDTPLSRMAKTGIRRYGQPRGRIEEAMEERALREIHSLERYVPALGTIAHLAPLLGLLGTVTGLVRCFQVIQEKATTVNPVNPGDLAGGIWEALLTTVFGLIVAIPAYAMYNYLVHRINHFANDLEASSSELIDLLEAQEWPAENGKIPRQETLKLAASEAGESRAL
ncbi:MAG: MotA/TolQ/ExbB proton channel family protein [Candidatus Omnitrophica bacterium]|nr:MotA/TolQ/ExbB proton channel family protein [Candidatus Omnitrophota bacterium]